MSAEDRMNLRRRQEAAITILLSHGWTDSDVEQAISECDTLEQSVVRLEFEAKAALGL